MISAVGAFSRCLVSTLGVFMSFVLFGVDRLLDIYPVFSKSVFGGINRDFPSS